MTDDDSTTFPPGRVLLATRAEPVAEAVQATALALGVEVEVASAADEVRRAWAGAPLRLVGVDLAGRLASLERAGPTYVVGAAGEAGLIEASAGLRAPVLALPGAAAELADVLRQHLFDAAVGQVVTVVGASGGVGASALVVALATCAADAGRRSAAVELAECGGGLDLPFGAELREGVRWDGLAQADGQLGSLDDHLLHASGVAVLPLGRGDATHPDQAAVSAVLGSLVRSHDVVVVDAGRDPVPALHGHGGQVVLVVAADVAGVAAARMLVERHQVASARLVVRTGPGRSLPGEAVAEALGMDLLGLVRHDPAVPRLAETGTSVASRRARRFRRDALRIWEGVQR